MPKIKTRKSAAKRFKKTKNGKIKRGKAKSGHILTKKTPKKKRKLRKGGYVSKTDEKRIKKMLD